LKQDAAIVLSFFTIHCAETFLSHRERLIGRADRPDTAPQERW
jgi:hypothetical protein